MQLKTTPWAAIAALAIASFHLQAQPGDTLITMHDSLDVPFEHQMDTIFANLDLSAVTTNLLMDRSYQTIPVHNYNGTAGSDTLGVPENWMAVYGSLGRASTTGSYGLPDPETWRDAAVGLENGGTVPFTLLHYNYHRFKPDSALVMSLIYENEGQLYDHPNQATSPYEQVQAFAAAPFQNLFIDTLQVAYRFDSQFFFGNTGKTLQTIQVDFGAGGGWQTVNQNENITVTYPATTATTTPK